MHNYYLHRNLLIIFVSINTILFVLLAFLHFYWTFGGTKWYYDVLPTSSNGLHRFNPSLVASFIVSFGLMVLALITVGNLGFFDRFINRKLFRYGGLIISTLFVLRAIGDFKFIGFFKNVKGTRFAINDTQIFSPLCLLIALFSLLIFIFNTFRIGMHLPTQSPSP